MVTMIVTHDVEDAEHWAKAWKEGAANNRHTLFAKIGVQARLFHDPEFPARSAVLLSIPDLAAFQTLMESDEAKQAMKEDRLKVESLHMLSEFTP